MRLTDNKSPKVETCKIGSIDDLRQILIMQQKRDVTYDEASEIGDALIDFYEILSEEAVDESVA